MKWGNQQIWYSLLKKSFDTLDYRILLKKLKYNEFWAETFRWFGSYFKKRTLIARIDKHFSEPCPLYCGVPQRSILGAVIPLLYVNDMKSAVNVCYLGLYADDTLIYLTVKLLSENT